MNPTNPDILADQLLFQQAFKHGVEPTPVIPTPEVQTRRMSLVREEYHEFVLAWDECAKLRKKAITTIIDPSTPPVPIHEQQATVNQMEQAFADLADAIIDSIYVLVGTGYEYGLPMAEVWNEVQRANMAKLWTWEEVRTLVGPLHKDIAAPVSNIELLLLNKWTAQRVLVHSLVGTRYIVKDEIGKIRKPPSWTPPDILGIIKRYCATDGVILNAD